MLKVLPLRISENRVEHTFDDGYFMAGAGQSGNGHFLAGAGLWPWFSITSFLLAFSPELPHEQRSVTLGSSSPVASDSGASVSETYVESVHSLRILEI